VYEFDVHAALDFGEAQGEVLLRLALVVGAGRFLHPFSVCVKIRIPRSATEIESHSIAFLPLASLQIDRIVMRERMDRFFCVEPKRPAPFYERDFPKINKVIERSLGNTETTGKLVDVDRVWIFWEIKHRCAF
jgi:hypothetical protein